MLYQRTGSLVSCPYHLDILMALTLVPGQYDIVTADAGLACKLTGKYSLLNDQALPIEGSELIPADK